MTRSRARPGNRPRARHLVAVAALVTLAVACSDDDPGDAEREEEPEFTPSTVDFATDDPEAPRGGDDPGIPDDIPEQVHATSMAPLAMDEVVVVEDHGNTLVGLAIVDPETGARRATIDSAVNVFSPFVYPLLAPPEEGPDVLAFESWWSRGPRGPVEFTLSYYGGDLRRVPEVRFPEEARPYSLPMSASVTDDGAWFGVWDSLLQGLRLVDVADRSQAGTLELQGCGPAVLPVREAAFATVCWPTGEVVEMAVDSDGVREVGRVAVLPEDVPITHEVPLAREADRAVVLTTLEEAYILDFSRGLPDRSPPAHDVLQDGLALDYSGHAITNDASLLALRYSSGALPSDASRSQGFGAVVTYQLNGFTEAWRLEADDLDYEPTSMTWAPDGSTLWVLGEGSDGSVLVGYDSDGAETSRADLELQGDWSTGFTTVVAPIGLPVEEEGGSGGGPQ